MTITTTPKKTNARLSSPINILGGIGPKKAAAFAKIGVHTLEDIFFLMPRRYEDRRFPKKLADLEPDTNECAVAIVSEISTEQGASGTRTEAVIIDESGSARVVWFTEKIAMMLKEGMKIALYGPVNARYMMTQFVHPEFEILRYPNQKLTLIGKILPIYPGTADFTQRFIRKVVNDALNDYAADCLKDFVPEKILTRHELMPLLDAVMEIHNPTDEEGFLQARTRLSFDELFLLQAGITMRKNYYASHFQAKILEAGKNFDAFIKNLPFKLTHAQENAINEILDDMKKPYPMNRLLQGDVGSGKTLVAAAAMLAAVDSRAQAAFMAPTEILAQQHYLLLQKNLFGTGLNIALLTGSLKTQERRKILAGISDGSINIIVGTHALFSEDVEFSSLSLVIVDEQHRFGVLQRNELIAKSVSPHVLAMTATPIPRTLAMSVYGELSVSVLNEMPPGRTPVQTISMRAQEFSRLPKMITDRVKKHEQIFWVCPQIDESDRDLAAVNSTYGQLKMLLPGVKIAMIHGRLPVEEKAEIMKEFSAGNIDMLVATVVVEVGVDVPNASMIIIQDAGQFGLAQLHQLRGRVGRGKAKSLCVLMENSNMTPEAQERISAMVETSDGFKLAEQDLRQRGAGEICGTHQHGVTDFRVADLVRDEELLMTAREDAQEILNEDPQLKNYPLLQREIVRRLGSVLELATMS